MTYNIDDYREGLLEAIANETSLVSWCKEKGNPSYSTVMKWQREDETFSTECARAREDAGENSAHRQNEIINRVVNGDLDPSVARVALSGLQWRAEKLASKRYGDVKRHQYLDEEGNKSNPPSLTVNYIDADTD